MAHRLLPITPAPDGGLRASLRKRSGASLFLNYPSRAGGAICPMAAQQESAFGWGLNLSSTWRVVGRDTLNYQVAYGNGISRYAGDTGFGLGLDAHPRSDADLTLKALPTLRSVDQLSAQVDQIRPIECDVWICCSCRTLRSSPATHITRAPIRPPTLSGIHMAACLSVRSLCMDGWRRRTELRQRAAYSGVGKVYLREAAPERVRRRLRLTLTNTPSGKCVLTCRRFCLIAQRRWDRACGKL